jgi:hypothetical protein
MHGHRQPISALPKSEIIMIQGGVADLDAVAPGSSPGQALRGSVLRAEHLRVTVIGQVLQTKKITLQT